MSSIINFHHLALATCLWWSCGKSIAQDSISQVIGNFSAVYSFDQGLEDCRKTVNLTSVNNSIIYVSNGTAVCFECDYSPDITVNDVVFRINGVNVTSSKTTARVVKNETQFIDTLVVFDSESVFSTSSVTDIQCCVTNILVEINKVLLCNEVYFMVQVGVVLFYGMIIMHSVIKVHSNVHQVS